MKTKIKIVLKFIGNELLFIFALAVFIVLVTALGVAATILLAILGRWIGIGKDIFIYFALFCTCWKAWDALVWVVGKIVDRNERKKRT